MAVTAADEAFEQALDGFVELVVLDRDRRLAGERRDQLGGSQAIGDDLGIEVFCALQDGVEAALAVDQLQHADDLVLVILHRDRQHRPGVLEQLVPGVGSAQV